METVSTKQLILETALDLFSKQGYEAASMGQIAEAVGIRKASLYSHFKGKQEILDTLIALISQEYEAHSLLSQANALDEATNHLGDLTPEVFAARLKGQLRFLLHDDHISKVRKLLTIEQYRNPELAAMQTKRVYEDVLAFNVRQMQQLIRSGIFMEEDPEIMAAQFAFPISAWLNLCDREPEREEEVMERIDRHVRQFYKIYRKDEKR